MFNLTLWNDDRIAIEKTIRDLKLTQRESKQPNWVGWRDGPALIAAKRRATALYTLRAHRRGRLHAFEADPEATKKLIAEWAPLYETAPAPESLTKEAVAQ